MLITFACIGAKNRQPFFKTFVFGLDKGFFGKQPFLQTIARKSYPQEPINANTTTTSIKTVFSLLFKSWALIIVALHRVEVGKVIQTGAVTSPAALPAAIGLRVAAHGIGAAAAAARRVFTTLAHTGGIRRVIVGFAHGYNITPKGAFVKGELTHNLLTIFGVRSFAFEKKITVPPLTE
jgi:hypothetical protein